MSEVKAPALGRTIHYARKNKIKWLRRNHRATIILCPSQVFWYYCSLNMLVRYSLLQSVSEILQVCRDSYSRTANCLVIFSITVRVILIHFMNGSTYLEILASLIITLNDKVTIDYYKTNGRYIPHELKCKRATSDLLLNTQFIKFLCWQLLI